MSSTYEEKQERYGMIWRVADHYNGLVKRGVPESVAMELTSEFQAGLMNDEAKDAAIIDLRSRVQDLEVQVNGAKESVVRTA